ncbi:hypothetical protein [Fimbriimonas ginsengisoli]|uniref:Uncharacterized protein n=1 Tax=Fimbriimonas ginsengisoli Gsoil 348 TaxID=661478 RepID=A0A068NP47_FIMGI|nr:hypothetical protein [Fimbriimonas ginsengisoli]AIE85137.1 hypothetical protein OP10G_1769 [Fimbriimonas ginsengisoli Gsoil 348]
MPIPLLLGLALAALPAPQAPIYDAPVIKIFDLQKIHSVPLDAQVMKRTEANGVVTEEIRYTAMPGIRAFAYMSYPAGAKNLATNVQVLNSRAESRRGEAEVGFVGFCAAAPSGNTDPNKQDTVGGAKPTETFMADPQKDWIYQHVVIQLRALDYLATRPEVDMKRVVVSGFSWSGFVVALMHALDNRPACYVTWNSTGYYADEKGFSGIRGADDKSLITREQYLNYCPSAYAQWGTQPIFVSNALTDYFATLDGAIIMFKNLKSPKRFVWAPNRYHADTARHEYMSSGPYMWQWQGNGPKTPTVNQGAFEVKDGKLLYKYYIEGSENPTRAEVMYSYGNPGHWIGRTWHRIPAVLDPKQGYVAEIPVYDPDVPVYVLGQIETKSFKASGNCPDLYIPKAGGITAPNATYPTMLMDFEDRDDLYFGRGIPEFVGKAAQGQYCASVEPFEDGTVHLLNIEPFLWKDAKELHFFLKGDGKPGPLTLYLVRNSQYALNKDDKSSYSAISIVGPTETFAEGWHEYAIPLDKVRDLKRVDSLWFDCPGRNLVIDGVQLK